MLTLLRHALVRLHLDIHRLTNLSKAISAFLQVGTLTGALTTIENPGRRALLRVERTAAAAHVLLNRVRSTVLLVCFSAEYPYLKQ